MSLLEDLKGETNETIKEVSDEKFEDLKGHEVGAALHDDWRTDSLDEAKRLYETDPEKFAKKGYTMEDGVIRKWKPTKDDSFVYDEENPAHNREEAKIDILNLSFEQLSASWQGENLEAGRVAVKAVGSRTELTEEEFVRAVSEVHAKWLERNDWAKGGELDVPYGELDPSEQAKDDKHIRFALALNKEIEEGTVTKNDLAKKYGPEEPKVQE